MTDQTVSLLQLVKRKDADNSDVNAVDFLALPTELQYQGWNQGLPQPNQPSVDESITLLMNAGNANTLATALQSIDTKIKEIGWAQDPLNPIGVWLRAQLTGETNPRQCFILAAKRPPKGLAITNPLAYGGVIPDYNLGLTRMPRWENLVRTQIPASPSAISIHGGTIQYTLAGDAHARVVQAYYTGVRNNVNTLDNVWIGVKSSRYGVNPANFIAQWYLADGNAGTDTATNAAGGNSGALQGTEMLCTFGTNSTMVDRVYMTVAEAVTDSSKRADQRGRYTVLLRARPTDPSLVVMARLGLGFLFAGTTLTSMAFKPRIRIATPVIFGWQYYTMGQITIPATSGFTDLTIDNTCLTIQAEKVAGTGNLEIDNLLLIPAEHTVHVASVNGAVGGTIELYIQTRPDMRMNAFSYGTFSNLTDESMTPDSIDWQVPSGSGAITFAGSNQATLVDDKFTPSLQVYPSYNSLRGAS